MDVFLNSLLFVPSQGPPKLNQNHSNAKLITKSSRTNTPSNNNQILSHNDHTSDIITNVDTNNKNLYINSCTIPLQTVQPNKIQPPEEKSTIESDHEPLLPKTNINKFNDCNTSVNLLVDIEKWGNNDINQNQLNQYSICKTMTSLSLHTQQIIFV